MTFLSRRVYEYGEDAPMPHDDVTPHAERAALGEILAACPRCGSFDARETNRGAWACAGCGHRYLLPAYFQRVAPPGAAPAGLTREQIAAAIARARETPDPAA
jgi:ribosomal protein L37AE/L43A